MRGERVKVGEICIIAREREREGYQGGNMKTKEWTLQGRKADSKEERKGKQEEPPLEK